jgi:hypothetical protein
MPQWLAIAECSLNVMPSRRRALLLRTMYFHKRAWHGIGATIEGEDNGRNFDV